jgi:hypothetical protein
VVLQLGGLVWGYKLLAVKNNLVTKIHKRPRTWTDGMDWIKLAQDRDQWRALVNMAMNLWVP